VSSAAFAVRSRTIDYSKVPAKRLALERFRLPIVEEYSKPRKRSDCVDGPRPCPFVGCRWHLYLDVRSTSIKYNFPDLEVDELTISCALDVADQGPSTLDQVSGAMNITRERVRQIETIALSKLTDATASRKDELL